MLAWTRLIRDLSPVRDGHVPLVDDRGDGERGLHLGFVERGKGVAGGSRFELGRLVLATVDFTDIETLEVLVQNTAIGDVDRRRTPVDLRRNRQVHNSFPFAGRPLGLPAPWTR